MLRDFKLWVLVLLFLLAMDFTLTMIGIERYGIWVESNPLAREMFLGSLSALIFIIGSWLGIIYFVKLFLTDAPDSFVAGCWAFLLFYFIAVHLNWFFLLR